MELYLNKKNDGISVDIDFDELIDQYGQQLIEAIAKRKKALEEISGLPDKDFPLLVIKEARTAASKENMQKSLQHFWLIYRLYISEPKYDFSVSFGSNKNVETKALQFVTGPPERMAMPRHAVCAGAVPKVYLHKTDM